MALRPAGGGAEPDRVAPGRVRGHPTAAGDGPLRRRAGRNGVSGGQSGRGTTPAAAGHLPSLAALATEARPLSSPPFMGATFRGHRAGAGHLQGAFPGASDCTREKNASARMGDEGAVGEDRQRHIMPGLACRGGTRRRPGFRRWGRRGSPCRRAERPCVRQSFRKRERPISRSAVVGRRPEDRLSHRRDSRADGGAAENGQAGDQGRALARMPLQRQSRGGFCRRHHHLAAAAALDPRQHGNTGSLEEAPVPARIAPDDGAAGVRRTQATPRQIPRLQASARTRVRKSSMAATGSSSLRLMSHSHL